MYAKAKYLLELLNKVKVKGSGIVDLKPLAKISKNFTVEIPIDDSEGNSEILLTVDDWVTEATNGEYKTLDEVPDYEVGATGYVKVAVSDISDLVTVVVDEQTHEVTSITVPDIIVQVDSVYIIHIQE